MSGAIPPLSQYALMVWCSVKAQGQLFYFTLLYFSTNLVLGIPRLLSRPDWFCSPLEKTAGAWSWSLTSI